MSWDNFQSNPRNWPFYLVSSGLLLLFTYWAWSEHGPWSGSPSFLFILLAIIAGLWGLLWLWHLINLLLAKSMGF